MNGGEGVANEHVATGRTQPGLLSIAVDVNGAAAGVTMQGSIDASGANLTTSGLGGYVGAQPVQFDSSAAGIGAELAVEIVRVHSAAARLERHLAEIARRSKR